MAGRKPGAVVRVSAASANHGELCPIPSFAGDDPSCPAWVESEEKLGHEKIHRISLLIRKNHIRVTVIIDVGKTEAAILPLSIDHPCSFRQCIVQILPRLLAWRPFENSVLV